MQHNVGIVRSAFKRKQSDGHCESLFKEATELINTLHLKAIEVPNTRRCAGEAVDYYRGELLKVLNNVDIQI